jgi:hypothetical protein
MTSILSKYNLNYNDIFDNIYFSLPKNVLKKLKKFLENEKNNLETLKITQ